MHKVEQIGIHLIGLGMGIWFLIGCVFFPLFTSKNPLTILNSTLSIYFWILVSCVLYFLIKKAFSDLLETGLDPNKKEKKKN